MEVPEHLKDTISVGEDVLIIFNGDYSRKGKKGVSISNGLMIITSEKLIVEGKKDIEKVFLTNVLNVDQSKNKIKMNNFSRDGTEEEKIEITVKKQKKEEKKDFLERCKKIKHHLERYLDDAAESLPEGEKKKEVMIKPDKPEPQIITPKPTANQKVFCFNCGERLPEHGKFCPSCGQKVR
ncbi:MAG: hypothetical protein ACTSVY_14130 [Candidatus Helarchaeota archaeon]